MQNISLLILGLISLYAIIALLFYFFQESILFVSKSLKKDYQFHFEFDFQERNYEMKDGAMINCLFIPAKSSKGVILYFHGNTGNLIRWGKIGQSFTQYGYDVLICDYRGYGKSSGVKSMSNFFSDAKVLYDVLLEEYKEKHIIIYGRSIGSGIASWLAFTTKPKCLILETPFCRMKDVSVFRFLLLPIRFLLRFPFPNYRYLKTVSSPIHIFHGTNDMVVPYSSGKKLYDMIKDSQDVKLTTIEGGKHNNLVEFDEFRNGIKNILD